MPPFIGYEDLSGVFNCGPLFEMGGEAPHWESFTILLYSLFKKVQKRNGVAL